MSKLAEYQTWKTTQVERESAQWAGEGLREDFKAGSWENDFVYRLASDAITAIAAYQIAIAALECIARCGDPYAAQEAERAKKMLEGK